ncbi:arrestin domain-containing protein [Arthroderma uncinatum]|uniref:arrestin domain-containing protein n=1 Tax=Arthroderma uncinatum TaxID=74035 RepID=UPI00144ACB5A|nr:arrestin domain-containing protein [Arthroderma uncinatum]KAF3490843.1 arrestin domain-containing protein [Arthroderma uncinatum]
MAAFVRVSGPPNSNFLVGYPGISATLPRIEGKVEVRPSVGVSAAVNISMVTICLQRRETIHPAADSMTKRHLAAPRKDVTDIVGKEMLLFRCPMGREYEEIIAMDLPFVLFIPFGRGGQETSRRLPPASLQLGSRTAETYYELVVMIQQGQAEQKKYSFPVPMSRYDTLSTFGMYNRPEAAERVSDHLITLGISLPRWSYGPFDPVSVYVKLSPNPDWMSKARKVTIQKITLSIDEEIVYNHEGDEPYRKGKTLAKRSESVNLKMPEAGYLTNLGLVFPARDLRDSDGVLPRGKPAFPTYAVSAFTTTASLYKIEYYLTVKAHLTSAKDIVLRQPIVVCPLDHAGCKEEMEAIEQAAREARNINPDNPMLPLPTIIRAHDHNALQYLNVAVVGNTKKPVIE